MAGYKRFIYRIIKKGNGHCHHPEKDNKRQVNQGNLMNPFIHAGANISDAASISLIITISTLDE
jgi:hypothetical protein